jgi:hypothetical protein
METGEKRRLARRLESVLRACRRNTALVRVISMEFRGFFLCVAIAMAVSTLILHAFYPRSELPHPTMTWTQAVYYTWRMIFFQTPLNYVHDWRIVPLFFALPLLGW